MTHSSRREFEKIHEIARTRRVRLSSRAMLALFIRAAEGIAKLAARLRGTLDPDGGADAPRGVRTHWTL